jgi:hypothetical protein
MDLPANFAIEARWCGQISVPLDRNTLNRLRISVIPQRWPACRGYVRGLGFHPDVIEDLACPHALGDERNQTHLPTADWAQQRELSIS